MFCNFCCLLNDINELRGMRDIFLFTIYVILMPVSLFAEGLYNSRQAGLAQHQQQQQHHQQQQQQQQQTQQAPSDANPNDLKYLRNEAEQFVEVPSTSLSSQHDNESSSKGGSLGSFSNDERIGIFIASERHKRDTTVDREAERQKKIVKWRMKDRVSEGGRGNKERKKNGEMNGGEKKHTRRRRDEGKRRPEQLINHSLPVFYNR
jgi:hypothetical protein